MKAIHQLLPSFAYGDAISNEALVLRDMLRSWGYESNIYVDDCDEQMAENRLPLAEHKKDSSPANGVILHHSISSPVSDYCMPLKDKKILVYHNITPPHFFHSFADSLDEKLDYGRKQLKRLRKKIDVPVADSEYNANELRAFGYKNVRVLPVAIDFSRYEAAPCPYILSKFDDGLANILYVGRIAPNKKVEDVLRVFASYQKRIEPRSRLILVGKVNMFDRYHSFLFDVADELGVKNLHVTGHIPFDKLVAFYRVADLFILMSEHEGFGVPLLEAMYYGVPIVAYKSSAAPETLGRAGVLVVEKRFDHIAEMVNLILTDEPLRQRIIEGQKERLKDFRRENVEAKLKEIVGALDVA
ncbi:MAG: glycosyltransferase [Candidatus Lindowbacteria bacterium]|nr:glycosyltransferase [Candidatus Lindowbacteria bacterium]